MSKSTVKNKIHLSQLKGIVKTKRKKPVTLSEMKKAISESAQEKMFHLLKS